MTPARMLSIALGALSALAVVGVLALTLILPEEISVPASAVDSSTNLPSAADIKPAPEQVAVSRYPAMAERPLFAPDRSPFVPPEPDAEVVQDTETQDEAPPQLEAIVLGIFVTPEKKLASIWMAPSKSIGTFVEGEYLAEPLNQWRVEEIQNKRVVFAARNSSTKSGLNLEVYDGELGQSQGGGSRGNSAGSASSSQAQANDSESSDRDPASMTPEERRELIRKRIAEARARRQAEQNREDN